MSKISGYPPQGPGAIGLIIDAAIATHAALTSTHGVAEVANAADLTTHIAKALADAHSGLLNFYKISDNLLHSHDAETSSVAGVYAKLKTITLDTLILSPSTLRIKFDMRAGVAGPNANARIYKNGGAVGVERSSGTGSFITYSEDLSFAEGDTLELWGKNAPAAIVYVRNFRVYGDEDIPTIGEAITASNPGVADPFDATNS